MKPFLACLFILASSIGARARLIPTWSDQELFEKSDLIVIASPSLSADTTERTGLPGLPDQRAVGVETRFYVSTVVKGDKDLKDFVLHHYKAVEPLLENGPDLIAFKPEEKRTYLLHLVKQADGRYAPTVGQVDPASQGIVAIHEMGGRVSCVAPPSETTRPSPSALAQHAAWVEKCFKDLESIHVGMTRAKIDSKLSKDGGLQGIFSVRYTHPECPMFKIDVDFEFKLNPDDQIRAIEGKDDKALKVTSPRIERPFGD